MTVMKKIIDNSFTRLLFASMMLMAAMFVSCNNDEDSGSGPMITEVRNYAAAPNDTLVNKLVPGQWVVLKGSNLKDAVKIAFNGIAVDFNGGLFADDYAVVQVPAVIPFPSVAENDLNTIELVTPSGKVVFDIDIVAGPPALDRISNENALPGEEVVVYGTNLFQISELIFAGVSVQEFTGSDDGTSVSFTMPDATAGGPLKITTASGEILTSFNVNDLTTGMLCNFDTIGNLSWGTSTSDNDPDFPNSRGVYPILNPGALNAGNGSWWEGGRSINIDQVHWIQPEDLTSDLSQFALKFEVSIAGMWKGSSIFIVKDYNWTYLARYEPWKTAAGKGVNTEGKWITVTIPLTEFRTKKDNKEGTGDPASSLTELVGTGTGGINFFTINDASTPAPGDFRVAVDNIRVVKILDKAITK